MRKRSPGNSTLLSPEEFLARERTARVRHEYVAGELYAMSPVSKRHSTIALNIAPRLKDAARGGPCTVYIDVLTHVARDRYYYPDVVIACAPHDHDEDVVHAPCFVVEITSPSTRATDLREKAAAYRGVPSLQGYLVVEQKRRGVISYRRTSADSWDKTESAGTGVVEIPCVDLTFSLDDIYEGLELPRLQVREGEDEYTLEEYEGEHARLVALGFQH